MIIQFLAMVSADDQQRLVRKGQLLQPVQDVRDAQVRVGDLGIILGADELEVPDARQPFGEVVGKPGGLPDRLHTVVGGRLLITAVEHPIKRRRRQIRSVRVPIMKKEKERLVSLMAITQQPEATLRHLLPVPPRLRAVVIPTRVLLVLVKGRLDPATDVIDRRGEEAALAQQDGQQANGRVQLLMTALRHNLVAEHVLPREERRVRRLRRDVRADTLVEAHALFRQPVQVRGGETRRAGRPQPVPPQAVNDDPDDVHHGIPSVRCRCRGPEGVPAPPTVSRTRA